MNFKKQSHGSKSLFHGEKYCQKFAFTLVELIVVVTILAILATIGFVSYSSYLTGVRDTNRLSQLVSIHDGLELYRTKNDLPLPDDNIEIQIATDTIGYQGYAGANTLETIDFTKGGKDPKDDQYFSYYLTKDRKKFQLLAFLEEDINTTTQSSQLKNTFGIDSVSAIDYSHRVVSTYGKELGILTDLNNTPIQELPLLTEAGVLEVNGSTTDYIAYFNDTDNYTGNGTALAAKISLNASHVSGFQPDDVGGLYMWFDANDATTIEKTGNIISKWSDKSNEGNHLNVVEGDPTYGDYKINGLKTVYFDGTDSMHTTAAFDAPYTIIYAAQMEGTLSNRAIGGDGNFLIGFHGGTKDDLYLAGWVQNSTTAVGDSVELYSASRDESRNTYLFNNGKNIDLTSETTGSIDFGRLWIGGSGPDSGISAREKSKVYMLEIIVYDEVISDDERKKVEAYLHKKWGPF